MDETGTNDGRRVADEDVEQPGAVADAQLQHAACLQRGAAHRARTAAAAAAVGRARALRAHGDAREGRRGGRERVRCERAAEEAGHRGRAHRRDRAVRERAQRGRDLGDDLCAERVRERAAGGGSSGGGRRWCGQRGRGRVVRAVRERVGHVAARRGEQARDRGRVRGEHGHAREHVVRHQLDLPLPHLRAVHVPPPPPQTERRA